MKLFALSLLAVPLLSSDCTHTSTGFQPLTTPWASYLDQPTGLYPATGNYRPAAHEQAGLKLAASIQPLNAAGVVDETNGRVVLLSLGMSNTTAEFSTFVTLVTADAERHPKLLPVDGAIGGWSADRVVATPDAYWAQVLGLLRAQGITAAQVQAAWLKQADAGPQGAFPTAARTLQAHLKTIVQMLPSRFPNLKLVYLSSRIYAGYASTALNPEPYAYESGYSVRWLIEEQLNGAPELSYLDNQAPWLAWGPYLWADGTQGRSDGLTWSCTDLADDGTHPSDAGQLKVARMLLDFFKTDSTSRAWFVRPSKVATPKIAAILNGASFGDTVANGSIGTIFGDNLAGTNASAQNLPLPLTLAGVRVEVGGTAVPLYFVSPGQINFLLPEVPPDFHVVVARDDARSSTADPTIALYAPALFAGNDGVVAARHAGGRAVTAADPAHAGETIELYGTGIGLRNPAIMAPEPLPQVYFGPLQGTITYAGRASAWPGLYQWNVTVPGAVPTGKAVPVEIRYGSAVSNKPLLPV